MFAHEIFTSISRIEAHIQTGPKKGENMKKRTNFLKKKIKKNNSHLPPYSNQSIIRVPNCF